MKGAFVWIRGHKGKPVPEKWPDAMGSGGKEGKQVLARHELGDDEFALSIAILEQRYPPPPWEPEPPRAREPVVPPKPRPLPPAGDAKKLEKKLEDA